MTSHYELRTPTAWAEPPTQFSFSSLQAIEACPRRWQLVNSEWGDQKRFPERSHPAVVEGRIVHEALDLLSRALWRVGRPPMASTGFQEAVARCGFWGFFEDEIRSWNARILDHPRTGPGFLVRTPARDLANRAIRLFRTQYRPSEGFRMPPPGDGSRAAAPAARLRHNGLLSEEPLAHPYLPLRGVIDLVLLDADSSVRIIDFKTGAEKENHQFQVVVYAVLWWRATGSLPSSVEVQYADHSWRHCVSQAELESAEQQLGAQIKSAASVLSSRPAPARPTSECAYCAVRARCDEGWLLTLPASPSSGRADCELTVASEVSATGFVGLQGKREIAVVFDRALGAMLPRFSRGDRLRLIDAFHADDGKSVEIKPWTECYLS